MSTFHISRAKIVASAISTASPNLPFGEWTFVTETVKVKDASGTEVAVVIPKLSKQLSRNDANNTISFYEVRPTGNPNGTSRRIYLSALASPSAESILFVDDKLVWGATFGIYLTADGTSCVSADAQKVAAGIAQAQVDYAAKRVRPL